MKVYNSAEISEMRRSFEQERCLRVEAAVDGVSFAYFIIPRSKNPHLRNFVLRATGNPSDGSVFGISDEVPEVMMPYPVFHEYQEFLKIGVDQRGRCVSALDKELSVLPTASWFPRREYLWMRERFFADLIPYATRYPQFFNEQDIKEFAASLQRLRSL